MSDLNDCGGIELDDGTGRELEDGAGEVLLEDSVGGCETLDGPEEA